MSQTGDNGGWPCDGRAWTPNRVFYNAADPTYRNANVNFFADYNNLALIALAVVSGGLLAWPAISRSTRGKTVNTATATQLINKRGAVVVDIREPAEYAKGHLPQAKSAPLADLPSRAAGLAKDKAAPIIVVCQTGQRSGKAQAALKEAGYSEIYALEGGIAAWQQAGLPLVK
ncbi:Rhodanese-like sulfurtransferase [Cupriavidus necator]|uniref:Rhodanese-like sulfurtransferase n=1 Tax=Cupriavidus necator TaxID=106590 RepID=A0A1K0I8U5_CUPNE|nr:Rhodanese-like sulfurtransferase [Cupriavidus necator]